MGDAHPKLCMRPRPRSGLNRPTLNHPVLGRLQYINRDGGWWQGTTVIADAEVRLDLQQPANPAVDAVQSAAAALQWIQKNEPAIRAQIGEQLAGGKYRSNLWPGVDPEPIVDSVILLPVLLPTMVALWQNHADLYYSCDRLSPGKLLGAHEIGVFLGEEKVAAPITVYRLNLDRRAQNLLERPVPAELADFVDSLADQFVAKAAGGGLQLSAELQKLLATVTQEIENRRVATRSVPGSAYLPSVLSVLHEIASLAETVIQRVCVYMCVRHPAGKRLPFKQKLVFAPGDRARFDSSGKFSRVALFDLNGAGQSQETFFGDLQSRWLEASDWLARQSPAVFQELRDAGFETEVHVYVDVRMGEASANWSMPAELLAKSGRLGLGLSTATSNSAP